MRQWSFSPPQRRFFEQAEVEHDRAAGEHSTRLVLKCRRDLDDIYYSPYPAGNGIMFCSSSRRASGAVRRQCDIASRGWIHAATLLSLCMHQQRRRHFIIISEHVAKVGNIRFSVQRSCTSTYGRSGTTCVRRRHEEHRFF